MPGPALVRGDLTPGVLRLLISTAALINPLNPSSGQSAGQFNLNFPCRTFLITRRPESLARSAAFLFFGNSSALGNVDTSALTGTGVDLAGVSKIILAEPVSQISVLTLATYGGEYLEILAFNGDGEEHVVGGGGVASEVDATIVEPLGTGTEASGVRVTISDPARVFQQNIAQVGGAASARGTYAAFGGIDTNPHGPAGRTLSVSEWDQGLQTIGAAAATLVAAGSANRHGIYMLANAECYAKRQNVASNAGLYLPEITVGRLPFFMPCGGTDVYVFSTPGCVLIAPRVGSIA